MAQGSVDFSRNAEVTGNTMLSLLENINHDHIAPILEQHRLTHIYPDKWYPIQVWLDVLSDIQSMPGGMFDLVAIGMNIIERLPLPPEVDSVEVALLNFGEGYQWSHRNGDVGEIYTEILGERHVRVTISTPYPPDLMYGMTYAMARRLLPADGNLTVNRTLKGDTMICDVTW